MIVRVEELPEENLPIRIIDRFKIPIELDRTILCFTLFSYERIIIHPNNDLLINLPYKRIISNNVIEKHWTIELHKDLISKKMSIVWSNINDLESSKNISFLLRNDNILLREDLNELTTITGTHKKIDILPNKPIIRVFIN